MEPDDDADAADDESQIRDILRVMYGLRFCMHTLYFTRIGVRILQVYDPPTGGEHILLVKTNKP